MHVLAAVRHRLAYKTECIDTKYNTSTYLSKHVSSEALTAPALWTLPLVPQLDWASTTTSGLGTDSSYGDFMIQSNGMENVPRQAVAHSMFLMLGER